MKTLRNRGNIFVITISVEGLKLDYICFNYCGFLFYSIYSTLGYFYPGDFGVNGVEI